MNTVWLIATSVVLYAQKAIGVAVPATALDRAWIRRVLGLLPVALLAALTATQTFGQAGAGGGLVIDARVAGVAAAAIALALRAPFLVVVVVAAVTAAGLRALT